MRTETGKMPASFIFPIGNRPGESDERFGFVWYGCWMRWHSELSFGTMEAWLCARLALSLLLCSEDWLRRSPCASAMLKQGKRLGMALGLTGAVAAPRQSSSKLGSALGLRYLCIVFGANATENVSSIGST